MNSNLFHWTAREIEHEVRKIIGSGASTAECKAWAYAFVKEILPWWEPGAELSWDDAEKVGQRFTWRLARAQGIEQVPPDFQWKRNNSSGS